jgi:hypothetical protein
MTYINWDRPFFVDLSTGESVPPGTRGSIGVPTYAHYVGGNGFSANAFGGPLITQPGGVPYSFADLNAIGTPDQDALDIIDYVSYVHDVRSSQTGPVYNALQAQADAALLGSVVAIDSHYDPEAALMAGVISFGMVGSLALHGFLNTLSPFQLLFALNDAVHDIQYGLQHQPPGELANALNFIFEPSGNDPNVFVFDFAIKTTSFKQELLEVVAMNTLNAIIDGGEADNAPLHTGFPFPGTSHYELAYNAATGDLDLNAA